MSTITKLLFGISILALSSGVLSFLDYRREVLATSKGNAEKCIHTKLDCEGCRTARNCSCRFDPSCIISSPEDY